MRCVIFSLFNGIKKHGFRSKIVVLVLICLLFVSAFFGVYLRFFVGAQSKDSSEYWLSVARNAWSFFEPGVAVNSQTGLPHGDVNYPWYTDWDLATYIQAVMDAERIGLISRTVIGGE